MKIGERTKESLQIPRNKNKKRMASAEETRESERVTTKRFEVVAGTAGFVDADS